MKKRKRKCVWCGKRNVPYKGMVCNDCIRDLCGMDNIEIVTCNVASFGRDKTVIVYWNGWRAEEIYIITRGDLIQVKKQIEELRHRYGIAKNNVLIDADGLGAGLADFGGYKGFMNNAKAIFSGTADKWDYVIDYKKYNPDSKPTYEELVEALKDTHNLYLQAVKDKYFTHDITRIMSNDSIFLRLKHNE